MAENLVALTNEHAGRWCAWMVSALLDSAILLALVGLVWGLIRKRVSPQVGYALFLLIPLKLLVVLPIPASSTFAHWTPSALASSWLSPSTLVRPEPQPGERAPRLASWSTPDRPSEIKPIDASLPESLTLAHREINKSDANEKNIMFNRKLDGIPSDATPAFQVRSGVRLTWSGILMLAWGTIVGLLLSRFVWVQVRFQAWLCAASPVDEAVLGVDFLALCRSLEIRGSVRVLEHEAIVVPGVWGVWRPTLLLPPGFANSLEPEALRWVVLHELAHIKRKDLAVMLFQRVCGLLHFFNPCLWVANRLIDQLREYACDDVASTTSEVSALESGEAFLRMLERASGLESRNPAVSPLGLFALYSRTSNLRRIHRLLDEDRRIRPMPGRRFFIGLVMLALIVVSSPRASSEPPAPERKVEPSRPLVSEGAGSETSKKTPRTFELRVVGPDGKPVPEITVEFRCKPKIQADQVSHGTFVKVGSYGSDVRTDGEGRLALKMVENLKSFSLFIQDPGYGPYWAEWSASERYESIPDRFEAVLDAGWSVGGVVVDEAGNPVEGVRINPSIEFKKRPGLTRQLGVGTNLKTDAQGRWRFDSVPDSMREVHVEVSHSSFQPLRRSLSREGFGLEGKHEPTARITLNEGLSVVGRVTDEMGSPIAGARIRAKFLNDIREATTDADGTYKLAGCEPRGGRLVVSAKGKATDMKEVTFEPGMKPVDFQMKPGGTVRVRVLDHEGKPVPRARIFFQHWRGSYAYFEFGHVNQYADQEGRWVWNEAPVDEFQADICSNEGMDLIDEPLSPRDEEYVFRLPPPLVVTGQVIDAETRQPIKSFQVVPGVRSSVSHMNWIPSETYSAKEGQYEFRRDRGDFAHLFRIEAGGYKTVVSREFKSDEGSITENYELVPTPDLRALVVTPSNQPAVGAKIALGVAGSQIDLKNGDFDDSSTYSTRETTDREGRFRLRSQDKPFQVMIVHESGYAYLKSEADWPTAKVVHLKPWARVEGVFRVGSKPGANITLDLNSNAIHSYGPDAPSLFLTYRTTTSPTGKFVFDRVVEGDAAIRRNILLMANEGAKEVTSSYSHPIKVIAGKTSQVNVGGIGRPVVGRLLPAARPVPLERVLWPFAQVSVSPANAKPGIGFGLEFTVTVDKDGSFRIDDVPPDTYLLDVRFFERGAEAGHLNDWRFEVPAQAGKAPVTPVDLGEIRLEGP